MKRRNATRSALFTSIISLLLCVSMLVGTTFAWFTDEVKSGTNVIAAGNLDIELYHSNKSDAREAVTGSTLLFDEVSSKLWEPGALAYENFEIVNAGTLALKYNMELATLEESVVDGYKLSDVIMVGIKTGGFTSTTREDMINESGITWKKLSEFALNMNGKKLTAGSSDKFGLVLYWQPNSNEVDNHYNVKGEALNLKVGINLYATQVEHESDSFGIDYDANLEIIPSVSTSEELVEALNNGEDKIKLSANVAVDEELIIPNGVSMNLSGNTLTAKDLTTQGNVIVSNGTLELPADNCVYAEDQGNITLKDVVIDSDDLSVLAEAGGTVILKNVQVKNTTTSNPIQNYGGNLVMDNVTAKQEGDASTSWYSSAVQVVNQIQKDANDKWDVIAQANTTINSGTYTGKKAVQIDAPGGNVTINGGTFTGSVNAIQADFSPQNYPSGSNYESVIVVNGGTFNGDIQLSKAAKMTINGGTFNGEFNVKPETELVITGGTFSVDPSAYVPTGYKAIDNGNGTFSVARAASNMLTDTATAVEVSIKEENTTNTIVEVVVPKDAVENAALPVELIYSESEFEGNFTIEAGHTSEVVDISVKNLKTGNTTPIKAVLMIPAGLDPDTVKLYHNHDQIPCVYNPNSGEVTFETTSFSPFTVVYDEGSEFVPEAPSEDNMIKAIVTEAPQHVGVSLPWGSYGAWSPDKNVDADPMLEAAYVFTCPDTAEEAVAGPYANWYCDFYVMLDKDLGENQIFLGGNYGSFGWVGFHNGTTTLPANTEIGLLESVTSNPWTYADVANFVGEFTCGVGDVNNALKGATFTVMLRLTNPETGEYYNVNTINYTFE